MLKQTTTMPHSLFLMRKSAGYTRETVWQVIHHRGGHRWLPRAVHERDYLVFVTARVLRKPFCFWVDFREVEWFEANAQRVVGKWGNTTVEYADKSMTVDEDIVLIGDAAKNMFNVCEEMLVGRECGCRLAEWTDAFFRRVDHCIGPLLERRASYCARLQRS